jgi:hypothetical protein
VSLTDFLRWVFTGKVVPRDAAYDMLTRLYRAAVKRGTAGVLGGAVALSAVTSNNWAPRTQHPRKDPLSCVAYPENVCRSKRNGTVFVM